MPLPSHLSSSRSVQLLPRVSLWSLPSSTNMPCSRLPLLHLSHATAGFPLPARTQVALINWTTGAGNARYWVLKLLIDEVGPGDRLMKTTVATPQPSPAAYFCGDLDGHGGYGDMTLTCNDVRLEAGKGGAAKRRN